MVEEPDTATIRADWLASNVRPKVIWDLCDALDAARTELSIAAEVSGIVANDQRDAWRERALAAESADHATPLFEALSRAEAAEARIAAIHPDWWTMAEDLATAEAKNVEMGQRMDALAHRHDALDERTAELTEHLQTAEANLAEQERVTRLLEGALRSAEARIAELENALCIVDQNGADVVLRDGNDRG